MRLFKQINDLMIEIDHIFKTTRSSFVCLIAPSLPSKVIIRSF